MVEEYHRVHGVQKGNSSFSIEAVVSTNDLDRYNCNQKTKFRSFNEHSAVCCYAY